MKTRILFAFIVSMLFPLNAISQSLYSEGEKYHWEAGLNAGLNTDGFEVEFRGLFFPTQYVGLKIGLGFAGEIGELADYLSYWDDDWRYDELRHEPDYAVRFKFNPAIVLRSPEIFHWKSQDGGFYLFTEPGVVLSPGASGSRNAEWFRWDIKSGINLQVDQFIFTLGYGISNFSLYSGTWSNPDTSNYTTHSVYIGGAYKF